MIARHARFGLPRCAVVGLMVVTDIDSTGKPCELTGSQTPRVIPMLARRHSLARIVTCNTVMRATHASLYLPTESDLRRRSETPDPRREDSENTGVWVLVLLLL